MAVLDKTPIPSQKKGDAFLWTAVIILIAVGVVANQYFISQPWPLRLSGWIVLSCIVLPLSLKTALGAKLWNFSKEARGELRKVVWPTRDETVKTTLIIGVMVVIMSLILWGIDSILLILVNKLTS